MFKLKKNKRLAKPKVVKKPGIFKKAIRRIYRFKIVKGPTKAILGLARYFKGSWQELKLVRWPSTKATWGLTLAVLIFTFFFIALILLLDFAFKELFNLIIK